MARRTFWILPLIAGTVVQVSCGDGGGPAAIAKLGLVTLPSASAPDRVRFAAQPAVQIEDEHGNAIQRGNVSVTAAVISGGGTLAGTLTALTNGVGIARFADLSLSGTVGDRTIAFSTGGVPAVTASVKLTPGAAASIAAKAGDGQVATAGTSVSTRPAVAIADLDGNAVAGTAVTFAVASGGGTVVGPTQVSDSIGIATVGSWTLGASAGTNTLTATANGLSGLPLTFTATGVAGAAASITTSAGNNQSAIAGTAVATAPSVKVTDANGNAVPNVAVTFAVTGGGGTVAGATQTSSASGIASVGSWVLGSIPGTNTLTAAATGLSGSPVTFTAAGIAAPSGACQTGSPTSLSAGQVLTGLSGSSICLAGDATGSAEFALIPFFGTQTQSATTSIDVVGTNVSPVATASRSPTNGKSFSRSIGYGSRFTASKSPLTDAQTTFEAKLRARAKRELEPLIPSARVWQRTLRTKGSFSNRAAPIGPASVDAIPSTVTIGQILDLNTNATDPCTTPQMHAGRVVAITNKAIIVADTANPTPTFSDAQYASIGATFDTLVDPVDRGAFGAPSDIDGNGRELIFFTYAVNQLTPAGSLGVIGGFFYERDLFPTTSTALAQGCPTSNVGEMFYMLVPDPNGTINGNKRDTAFVRQVTIGTTAHEYQHLINAGRRMYVNNANSYEEVWLNEGLSHVAEELLYYRASGLSPRQNITAATIRTSQASVDQFNEYQNNNFGRFVQFLTKAPNASPYANNDNLETRGATWNMLRYLADHRSAADTATWQALANSTTTGLPNLANVFGANIMDQIRNWATSVESDDLPGVSDTRFLQPSWNLRSVFVDGYRVGSYPLTVLPLSNGTPITIPMTAGGEAYIRFAVAPGTQAALSWQQTGGGVVSSLVTMAIVRTK